MLGEVEIDALLVRFTGCAQAIQRASQVRYVPQKLNRADGG